MNKNDLLIIKELKKLEKQLNNWIVDFIIGGSYLGDYWTHIFEKLKKTGLEAYAHLLVQLEKVKEWYKD